jgi:sporulation protein YlmC with PRC-barrel domain
MDISIKAIVNCSDGQCGKTTRVILKPTTEEITHLVVSNEVFPETEYLVPIKLVKESKPNQILLKCTRKELSELPIFDQVVFVPSNLVGYTGSPYMMWPYFAPAAAYITVEKEHIPAHELAIRRGAGVEALDGRIGRVDEFLINPNTDHITHLVMREGHLWGRKDVTIPVKQIDHYQDGIVYLKLNKMEIEKLPTVPVRRNSAKKE